MFADHAERRPREERVDAGRVGIGDASMSDSLIALQPRIDEPSKPRPSSKVSSSRSIDRKGAVLPAAEHVDELQVDHVRPCVLRRSEKKSLGVFGKSAGAISPPFIKGERYAKNLARAITIPEPSARLGIDSGMRKIVDRWISIQD